MPTAERHIETVQKKKQKLLMFNAMGELSDRDFLAMNKECTQEPEAAEGVINKKFVDRYIDKIIATPEGNDTLHLPIKLFTGEVTDKYLQNLKSCTKHTFKEMRPLKSCMKALTLWRPTGMETKSSGTGTIESKFLLGITIF